MRTRVIACVGLVVFAVSSCSSGDDSAENGPLPACMENAGQDSSLEDVENRRLASPAYDKAFEKCAAELDLKILPPDEEIRQTDEMVLEQFSCMKDAGWEVPEPKRAQGALVLDGMEQNVPEDRLDEYDADYQTCTGRSWLHPSVGDDHQGHQHGR
jgi:hypothetical protein